MARFRHLRAASEWRIPHVPLTDEHRNLLDFDWRHPDDEWKRKHPSSLVTHKTTLENGDEIHVGYAGEGYSEFPDYWDYTIHGPVLKEKPENSTSLFYGVYDETLPGYTRSPIGFQEVLGQGGNGGEPRGNYAGGSYTSPIDAMMAAEKHYKSLGHKNRKITNDSGVNYDINDIMRRFDNGEL